MKSLERRVQKLEDYQERWAIRPPSFDREALRQVSRDLDAIEIGREYTELVVCGQLESQQMRVQELTERWQSRMEQMYRG